MYPRNSASPPEISVGAVVQISDGVVQTSGVSISVKPKGGSPSAGGNSPAYGTGGTVYYTPTQAETNYEGFIVEAYKTGCIPVATTIITTASSTAGEVKLANGAHGGAAATITTSSCELGNVVQGLASEMDALNATQVINCGGIDWPNATAEWVGNALTGAAYTVVYGVYPAVGATLEIARVTSAGVAISANWYDDDAGYFYLDMQPSGTAIPGGSVIIHASGVGGARDIELRFPSMPVGKTSCFIPAADGEPIFCDGGRMAAANGGGGSWIVE